MPRLLSLLILCALSALAWSAPASAGDWPDHPVTIIVPFGPGGNTDMMARLAAQDLSQKFGQNFIIENRPGAENVAGASGDGEGRASEQCRVADAGVR